MTSWALAGVLCRSSWCALAGEEGAAKGATFADSSAKMIDRAWQAQEQDSPRARARTDFFRILGGRVQGSDILAIALIAAIITG